MASILFSTSVKLIKRLSGPVIFEFHVDCKNMIQTT